MRRYVTRPTSWCSDTHDPEDRPTLDVIERDKSPVFTGLLDSSGQQIFIVEDPEPMGFVGRGS